MSVDPVQGAGADPGDRVLFLTSNGTGLGHLTRVMAIARRLGEGLEPSILTLSAAAPVAAEEGFHVEYFPSHNAVAAEAPRRWDRRLRRRIELLLDELQPRLLVFDGAHPYDGLVAALRGARRSGLKTVWCRRGLWRPGFGAEGIYWESAFDLVLEPGELAGSEDQGLTAGRQGATKVARSSTSIPVSCWSGGRPRRSSGSTPTAPTRWSRSARARSSIRP